MSVFAAPLRNMPAIRIQPNGDTLRCYVSGDEFYNRLHDQKGYTIVQNPTTGYWVYAIQEEGELVASHYVAGSVDPSTLGIEPNLMISERELRARHKAWEMPDEYKKSTAPKSTNLGQFNNLVIFVRFQGDDEIITPMSYIDGMYNDTAESAVSLHNFFRHVSYDKISIITHYFPQPQGNQVISVSDPHPREYYMPYNEVTNPTGYNGDYERQVREFDMIEYAVRWVNENCAIDPNLVIDGDNDGEVDNISFIVKGSYTGWADLLWPHKWNIWGRNLQINGKAINTFNFLLEGAGSAYFGTSTLCHEMFHTLSAPDLYHYYQYTWLHPVGSWDLMEYNSDPPQHMNAYMKYKYGHWIDSIPEIREQGTYTLRPLSDPENENNCWKIASQDPNQYYVVEYRNSHRQFETAIPGTGLLIYRIDTRFSGNESFDHENYFDEVYLFRPEAASDIEDGQYNKAAINPATNRTEFTQTTDPHPWLTGFVPDTTFEIRNVVVTSDSLTFEFIKRTGCRTPINLKAQQVTGNSATLTWEGFTDQYELQLQEAGMFGFRTETTNEPFFQFDDLRKGTEYKWRVAPICPDSPDRTYSPWKTFKTNSCYNSQEVRFEHAGNEFQDNIVPMAVAKNYSYTQQIVLAEEMDGPVELTKISFKYASSGTLTCKNACKIYMGHTDKSQFSGTADLVAFDNLQLVYDGPLSFTTGWNDIVLDEPFAYDGLQNMVIAFDDNSNAINDACKFFVVSTNDYMSLSYSSTNRNPDPENISEFAGSKNRKKYRSMMRFSGCVEGADDSVSIDPARVEASIQIETSGRTIFATTDESSTIRLFDIMGRELAISRNRQSHTFIVPASGLYILRTEEGSSRKVAVN